MDSFILTSIENGIQKVVLNRPSKKNAINNMMYRQLIKVLNESVVNKEVTCLVVTGNGDFYSSGNDFFSYLTSDKPVDIDSETAVLQEFINVLINYPKLSIAIVNGPAIGIMATTLALFDIVYASETVKSKLYEAYFSTPFSSLGLCAEGCSTFTFPRIMGPSIASEVLLLGKKLTAQEAVQLGLISRVYKQNSVNEVWEYLSKVSSLSKVSLAATKRLLTRWNKDILMEVNKQELLELKQIYTSPEFLENIIRFMTNKSKI